METSDLAGQLGQRHLLPLALATDVFPKGHMVSPWLTGLRKPVKGGLLNDRVHYMFLKLESRIQSQTGASYG